MNLTQGVTLPKIPGLSCPAIEGEGAGVFATPRDAAASAAGGLWGLPAPSRPIMPAAFMPPLAAHGIQRRGQQ
jgi:hypothetical protein